MSHELDFDNLIREWTDLGEEHLPDRYLRAALQEIETTPQSGAWLAPLEAFIMRLKPATPYLGVAAVIIAAAAAYFALSRPDTGPPVSPSPVPSAASESPGPSPTPQALEPRPVNSSAIELGAAPMQVRAVGDAIYALVEGAILRVDPETEAVDPVIELPPGSGQECTTCHGIIDETFDIGFGAAWVAYHYEDQSLLRRFNLDSGELEADIPIGTPTAGGAGASDVVVAFDSVWVVMCHSLTVARVDPATNAQVASIELGLEDESRNCPQPFALFEDERGLWVGATTGGSGGQPTYLIRIDPETEGVAETTLIGTTSAACGRIVAAQDGGLWVNSCPSSERNYLVRVDPSGAEPLAIRLGGYLGDPVIASGSVWVPRVSGRPSGAAALVRLDPGTGEILDLVQVADPVGIRQRTGAAAVAAFDSVWVAGTTGTLVRIPVAELAP